MKHLSHPLIGDANYGKGALNRAFAAAVGLRRLALHAASLRLAHPVTGAPLRFDAELPPDLAVPFARLGIPEAAWGPGALRAAAGGGSSAPARGRSGS